MSQSSHFPGSNLNPHTGRKAIIAMGALILGYTSFYLYLDRRDRKRIEQGRLALYEETIARSKENHGGYPLRATATARDSSPPALPAREHDAHHVTTDHPQAGSYRASGQPTPQNPKSDGSGHAYTKSPDYVKSYEKIAKFQEGDAGKKM
ncbi:uncharacterized protein EV420DRAFT_1480241 [Desarmillaria tabescens]|uniref:Uncharacterized protein n=1 Tax=Armillaria tabescens TaxID=1929756 RepID=A0AA39KDR9_ARMTA|nr:uncharacterized protein EV420DRAFT_1480241 [Desarmillaria tabescens]KAK0458085.1 hypothetical protein EV420DRAFT_1480241 [Desarmillaria tabescens]